MGIEFWRRSWDYPFHRSSDHQGHHRTEVYLGSPASTLSSQHSALSIQPVKHSSQPTINIWDKGKQLTAEDAKGAEVIFKPGSAEPKGRCCGYNSPHGVPIMRRFAHNGVEARCGMLRWISLIAILHLAMPTVICPEDR